MAGQILFSIIIANYNKGWNVEALLSSIFAEPSGGDFEVFFMDDASSDDSAAVAERFPVLVRRGNSRVGPARLRNMAAREAKGEYLLFVDSDVILPEGTLRRFKEYCRAGECVAVSGLEVLPPAVDNWISWFRALQVQDYFGDCRRVEGPLDFWGTTVGGVKREFFFGVGGFDERYRGADVEDHELAIRMKGKGLIVFAPSMTYRHSCPGLLELAFKQFRRAGQMARLDIGRVRSSSWLFGWRFKCGHVLSAAIVAAGVAAAFNPLGLPCAGVLLAFKMWLNGHLFGRALTLKGPLFLLYALGVSLVTGVSVVCGGAYGRARRALA